MSVVVQGLTKNFGSQIAVNDLTFSIQPGEIVGFLGPNGAGKSTTMKMICGYLIPTKGTALINGHDIVEESLEVRKNIGYLPEHNPLYEDMYVREYLEFVSRIHRIPKPGPRIREVIHTTGLEKEEHKIIGALSKGYKQRVGLAQAIIHDPGILILDEPTSGLDMNQLTGIRQLIKDMGKEKLVIFSSHIMQEVQALCQRVLIIHDGNLVADDSIDALGKKLSGSVKILVEFENESFDTSLFSKIPGVTGCNKEGKKLILHVQNEKDIKPEVFKTAVAAGLTIVEMKSDHMNIESIFQTLTKKDAV